MTLSELYTSLSGVCQTAYGAFRQAVEPPYIVYRAIGNNDIYADDANLVPVSGVHVELYCDEKDPELESSTEAALAGLGLTWDKTEFYVSSERLLEVVYMVEFVLDPEPEGDSSDG